MKSTRKLQSSITKQARPPEKRRIKKKKFKPPSPGLRTRSSEGPDATGCILDSACSLPHRAESVRLDLVHHPHFTRLPVRVHGVAQIFLRQGIDVVIRAVLRDLHYLAADLHVPVRIFRI